MVHLSSLSRLSGTHATPSTPARTIPREPIIKSEKTQTHPPHHSLPSTASEFVEYFQSLRKKPPRLAPLPNWFATEISVSEESFPDQVRRTAANAKEQRDLDLARENRRRKKTGEPKLDVFPLGVLEADKKVLAVYGADKAPLYIMSRDELESRYKSRFENTRSRSQSVLTYRRLPEIKDLSEIKEFETLSDSYFREERVAKLKLMPIVRKPVKHVEKEEEIVAKHDEPEIVPEIRLPTPIYRFVNPYQPPLDLEIQEEIANAVDEEHAYEITITGADGQDIVEIEENIIHEPEEIVQEEKHVLEEPEIKETIITPDIVAPSEHIDKQETKPVPIHRKKVRRKVVEKIEKVKIVEKEKPNRKVHKPKHVEKEKRVVAEPIKQNSKPHLKQKTAKLLKKLEETRKTFLKEIGELSSPSDSETESESETEPIEEYLPDETPIKKTVAPQQPTVPSYWDLPPLSDEEQMKQHELYGIRVQNNLANQRTGKIRAFDGTRLL